MRRQIRTTLSTLFLLLLVSGAVSAQDDLTTGPGQVKNKPPSNPELVAAIRLFQDDPSNVHWKSLTKNLQNASFLVPIRNRGEEFETDKDGTITIKAGVTLAFPTYRGANGLAYLPVHTDEAAIKDWLTQDADTLVLAAAQVWDLVLADKNWAGAFVNPGTKGMVLTRDALQRMKNDLPSR